MKVTGPFIKQVIAKRKLNIPLNFIEGLPLGVVIPFRDRHEHLQVLLPELESQLESQRIDYRIAIVEQEQGRPFNPGKIRNIGAALLAEYSAYYCFHDVDNIPVHANYAAANYPLRLVSAWSETEREFDVFGHYAYFSGAITILKEQFLQTNGYPNNYWGWGHEDEVFHFRTLLSGLVPFQDNEGVFRDLANPPTEAQHRAKEVQKSNKRLMVRQMRWGTFCRDGYDNLDFELKHEERLSGHIYKYTVAV